LELLQGWSTLQVIEPEDKDPILPGRLYIAPPDYHLLVEPGFFSLSIDPPVSFARPSIDVLFESMSQAYGSRALVAVLTGSNRDGAVGAAAVKRAGGRVLVQDPKSAQSPVAPRAVLQAIAVDEICGMHELAAGVVRWCREASVGAPCEGHRADPIDDAEK
jgi:two-component system chemotaxis response regulator CheB